MGKAKLFGTIGKMALGAVAPDVLEQGTKIVNDQLEKRKDYLKIPDVKLLDVEKATAIIDKYNFNHSEVPVKADLHYADALPNTIVKMEPKGNTSVAPNTFVKLYYIDEQTLIDSQLLAQEAESKKALKKQKTQEQIHNVLETTSSVSANIGNKLHFKKGKKNDDKS
ncbi:PASTA domain-containing protein [Leuconostoc pseudomesenteroides]|uniref:PASTA domain-containing protein n=1 Tax=Leuconostoc pseudomesenteroides TaxID=33968 RepID=UPI0021A6ECC9|nr:PASTA domain-containing protein [Leuconostoc pseudomesenteroides]MCT4413523.1 PASTA domain-containing protein [Leuconostoc pseudomesenteroides]